MFWAPIIAAVAGWALNKWGNDGSGGKPNQYPVQSTPEQKRILDEIWRVYKEGGSPLQKAIAAGGIEFINSMPTGADGFQFVSPELRGQPFAGGVKVPKLTINYNPNAQPPTKTPGAGGKGAGDVGRDARGAGGGAHAPDRPAFGEDPFGPSKGSGSPFRGEPPPMWDIYGGVPAGPNGEQPPTSPVPVGGQQLMSAPRPPAAQPSGDNRLRSAWNAYKQRNPNWGKMPPQSVIGELSGATGLPSEQIVPFLKSEISGMVFGAPR